MNDLNASSIMAQHSSRMGTVKVKQEEKTDTRIIVKE